MSTTRIVGRATATGTKRYAERHATRAPDFYRVLGADDGPRVSSIGLGTYLGECTAADDARYERTILRAIESGVNLIDTAINYRCQRSERAAGKAIAQAIRGGAASRDELVICSKGGYLPLEDEPPATRSEYEEYVEREYIARGVLKPEEIVAGGHAIAPSYLADQIARSLANLGLRTIDVYYVHNPEQQLDVVSREDFRRRMRAAFTLLEERCDAGDIGRYGIATWNGLRSAPDARDHLSLTELVAIARDVAGPANRFRVVQLPINLALNEAVRVPTQRLPNGRPASVLQCAAELGVSVVASATLMQSKLAAGLPPQLREALPGHTTDAQRAIAFVRELPVVASALVGMRSEQHLAENLAAGRR